MNKAELISLVAERTREPRAKAEEVVDAVFETLRDTLKRGEEVRVPAFGVFVVAETGERRGRNPKTGQEVVVPAGKRVRFRPAKLLREGL